MIIKVIIYLAAIARWTHLIFHAELRSEMP